MSIEKMDILSDIRRILSKVKPEYQQRIQKAIDYIERNGIDIDASYSVINREISIYLKKDENVIGYFTIDDFGLGRINSMHIEANEDDARSIGIESPRNKQLSRFMMLCALIVIQKSKLPTNANMLFHIDADASLGFWDSIGMINVEDYQGSANPQHGYEKTIELQNIFHWVLGTTNINILKLNHKRPRKSPESKASSNKYSKKERSKKGGRKTRNKKRLKIRRS
jgi:hypothetical protein